MGKINVNDQWQEAETPVPLTEVIRANNVLQPEMVSVQLNGKFLHRDLFESTVIEDGDRIDFLYFMGGGAR